MSKTQGFFGDYLPTKISKNPDLANTVNCVYRFDIEGAGSWTVNLKDGTPGVTEGGGEDADCVITCSDDSFNTLLENPAKGAQLFFMGKIKTNNVGAAMNLSKILG